MAKNSSGAKPTAEKPERGASLREETPATRSNAPRSKPSALLDTRVVYCGDNLEQLAKRSHKVIVALTVQEILDEHIAKKLA